MPTSLHFTRRALLITLMAVPLPAAAHRATRGAGSAAKVSIIVAIDRRGHAGPQWIDVIRDRIDANELAGVRLNARPLGTDEAQWVKLIRAVTPDWARGTALLNAPFRHVRPPATVEIVLGNQGGDDAFGKAPNILAFDLSALVNAYGASDKATNARLMRRLLSHEYTHLLINPYLASVGWSPQWADQDPFLTALRTLYNEGIANMRSIEGDVRWTQPDGTPTDLARDALSQLQPVMIERLKGLLATPSPDKAKALMRNISQGSLSQKWGAMPIALWLAADTGFAPERIATWVEAGPDGILGLAAAHATPRFQPAFADLQAAVAAKVAKYR